jgi:glucokinase
MKSAVIGLDIGGTEVKTGIVKHDGTVLGFSSIPTQKDDGEPAAAKRMLAEIRRLLQETGTAIADVSGIGIGMPGCIDAGRGIVLSSPNFPASWFNLPLRDDLGSGLGLPAVIDNDARAATLGEGWCGAAKGVRNYLIMTLGTGLGGGAVVDGKVLRGAHGFAGEFGHICVHPGGRTCGCGRKGCLEAYASATGALGHYAELGGKNPAVKSGKTLYDAATHGDAVAQKCVTESARALGLAIGSLLNAFNPEVVVLAGQMARSFPDLEKGIHEHAKAQSLREPYERVSIRSSPLSGKAGVIGAAALYAYQAGLLSS